MFTIRSKPLSPTPNNQFSQIQQDQKTSSLGNVGDSRANGSRANDISMVQGMVAFV
jgi:hypothetical protein